ncbi:hypothetical protein QAD02_011292 [Eretmocerus hayati]|uniref:Uncharacterized protein n=1 Tax=Eretmocerus hayati TaxID=131215 RepID=A0ACC2NY25_9HYME|nr:hypothetical protein QAD02_011292 [Eretmocerus hayati]
MAPAAVEYPPEHNEKSRKNPIRENSRDIKSQVSCEEIVDALKDLDLFKLRPTVRGNSNQWVLKGKNDPIWSKGSKRLDNRMTRVNLYFTVLQDRKKNKRGKNGILSQLKSIKFGEGSHKHVRGNSVHHQGGDKEIRPIDPINNGPPNKETEDELDDHFAGIHNLSCSKKHEKVIRVMDDSEFRWIYITPEQLELYRDLTKIDGSYVVMLCTANLIQTGRIRNHIVPPSHVYTLVAQYDCNHFVVAQALTEKVGRHSATDFLLEFVKSNVPPPDEMVVEYSSCLLAAICSAMNRMPLNYYIFCCFESIEIGSAQIPDTIIRAGIEKLVTSMKCLLDDKPSQVFKFYKNSLIYLSKIDDFEIFQEAVKSVIALSSYPYQNDIIQIYLDTIRDEMEEDYPIMVSNSQTTFDSRTIFSQPSDTLIEFEQHLHDIVHSDFDEDLDKELGKLNPHYSHQWYNEFFEPLIREFPLWTKMSGQPKIPDPLGNILRTADSYVRDLFGPEMPVSIPSFFEKNIIAIQVNMKLGRDFIHRFKHRMTKVCNENKYRSLSYEERWRNRNADAPADPLTDDLDQTTSGNDHRGRDVIEDRQNVAENVVAQNVSLPSNNDQQRVKPSRGRYTTPNTGIRIAHRETLGKKTKKCDPFIENGQGLVCVVRGHKYILDDTSVYDTLVRMLAHAYRNFADFRGVCDAELPQCGEEPCFLRSVTKFCVSQKLKDLYSTRALLWEAYSEKNELDHLLCDCRPGIFLEKLMHQHTAYDHKINCANCGVTEYRFITLEIQCDDDIRKGETLINYLDEVFFDFHKCLLCNEFAHEHTLVMGAYLALDFETMELNISLNALPERLVVKGKAYMIAGLIEKGMSEIEENYVSYTRTLQGSWYKQRSKKGKTKAIKTIPIVRISLALYVSLSES